MYEEQEEREERKPTPEEIDDAWQKVFETLGILIDRMVDIIKPMLDAAMPVIDLILNQSKEIWDQYLFHYGNKKIRHLAFHAKKARVRRKNFNRLQKDFLKFLKEVGNGKRLEG